MSRMGLLLLLVTTALAPIIWGSTYIVTSELLPPNSPLMAALIRALPAGMLLVIATRTMPKGNWWLRIALLGFLNIGFFFYCLFYAATYLPGGMAALVMSSQALMVIALSRCLLGSTLTLHHVIAGSVGIVGIGLLVLNNNAELSHSGMAIALLGTLSMALGVVLTKKWGRPKGMSLLGFTGWQLLFGGLMLAPVALSIEGIPSNMTLSNVFGYLYLGMIGAIVGYFLWFRGIEKLPAISISFLGFLSSVSACVLGYAFLQQTFTSTQLIGAIAIFASIILSNQKPKPITH
ncbi:EamA family transporter [Vibrio rumoiensis]|uniref:ABC transporter permease n=1 Tax=Vibrio rumoiensis 1S-45 TaxID=1188252 RepID=A0A1E5E2F0_9VIBR|nr:EamA family transporter [Vibrio rumoiensis]OEF25282.1 ABC transporter permease [Vibrio rumoiensis 1S-45]